MTTITITDNKLKLPSTFRTEQDLFLHLVELFSDKTILFRTSTADLNKEEQQVWKQHKKSGYKDFTDFKG